jgi:hypothetical protein
VETAGGLPTAPGPPVERDWPRMDTPNVLWFFGAFAMAFATLAVIDKVPESSRDVWELLVAVGFYLAYAVIGLIVLRRGWWIPGGLLFAVAVAVMPAIVYGITSLIGTFPKDPFADPFREASWSVILIGLVTMLDALVSFALTRFSFLFFELVLATLITAQFFLPVFGDGPSADAHVAIAIVVGGALVIVGLLLDIRGRRRDAFWFHAGGLFGVATALVYWASGLAGDADHGWLSMFVAATLVLILAALVRRATWAMYGVFGFYAPLVHWLTNNVTASSAWYAVVLLAIGVGIFALGVAVHRFGRVSERRGYFGAPAPEDETVTSA